MKKWRKEYGGDIAKATDKIALLREREAQRLLFESTIQDIDRDGKGMQSISNYFTRWPACRPT